MRTALICVWLAVGLPQVEAEFPSHKGYVNDFADLLSLASRNRLETLLRETARETTAEIALATVTSLNGRSVEDYATRLFNTWGIGKKGVNNGVLLLVAPRNRKVRIEVGDGLEHVLPDALAAEVISTSILPHFRNDDYPRGIEQGVARLVEIVRRKHVLTPEELARLAARADDRPPTWLMTGFFGVFIGIGFYMVGLGLRSKTSFPILFGGFFGGLPFLLSLVPVFNASIRVLGPLAVVAVVLGLVTGRSSPSTAAPQTGVSGSFRRDRRLRRTGLEGASGYSGSSDDDSSSRSSSSSSGTDSSSFGGGQSSGGGASGSW